MKFFFGLCILSVTVMATFADNNEEELNKLWKLYKLQYNKNYSVEEDVKRKALFRETNIMIEKHNKDEGNSWKMEHNQFSDLTAEEKLALIGGKPNIPDNIHQELK